MIPGIALQGVLRVLWKPLAAALVIGVLYAGVRFYGHLQYERGWKSRENEYLLAELKAFKEEAERLTGLSDVLERKVDELRAVQPKIIERLTRVEIQNPLPDGCVIPPDGLHDINSAIEQANAAIQSR